MIEVRAVLRMGDPKLVKYLVLALPALFSWLALQWPVTATAAIYGALLWAMPLQLIDAIRELFLQGPFIFSAILFAIPFAVAIGQLTVIYRVRQSLSRLEEFFVFSPMLIIGLIVVRAQPEAAVVVAWVLIVAFLIASWSKGSLHRSSERVFFYVSLSAVVCFTSTSVAFYVSPVLLPQALGPLVTLLLGVGLVGLLLAVSSNWPNATLLGISICIAATLIKSDVLNIPAARDSSLAQQSKLYDPFQAAYAWLELRPDLDDYRKMRRPYPLIIASAEGGGAYAAAHSYLVLKSLESSCPSFATHLFATVGVSGGSLGTLLYASDSERGTLPWLTKCAPPARGNAPEFLSRDLLSPLIAHALFLRTADFLLLSRGLVTEGSDVLADSIVSILPKRVTALERPLAASWKPDGADPATIFVATDVTTGNRVVLSPLFDSATSAETFPEGLNNKSPDLKSTSAVSLSARFPWITSAGSLESDDRRRRLIVDGGYFDNSGADTVIDLVSRIRSGAIAKQKECRQSGSSELDLTDNTDEPDYCKCPMIVAETYTQDISWSGCERHVFLVYIAIGDHAGRLSGYVNATDELPAQSYLKDPLRTLMANREMRSILALEKAFLLLSNATDARRAREGHVDGAFFTHQIPMADLKIPLGWKISKRALNDLNFLVTPTLSCILPSEQAQQSLPPDNSSRVLRNVNYMQAIMSDNGCFARTVARLFIKDLEFDRFAIDGVR